MKTSGRDCLKVRILAKSLIFVMKCAIMMVCVREISHIGF